MFNRCNHRMAFVMRRLRRSEALMRRLMTLQKIKKRPLMLLLLTALTLTGEAIAAQLQLAWIDNSANEDGFKIERRIGTAGTFVQIATVGSNVTSYTDSNLSDGTSYCYRVKAFNTAGDSPSVEGCQTTAVTQTFVLSISKSGSGTGTITSNPVGVNCGTSCNPALISGAVVSLVATPAVGSTFSGWSGHMDCTDGLVTMNANKSCTATFNKPNVNIQSEWLHNGAELLTNKTKYADINGDGKVDALHFDTSGSKGLWVSLGTETGFAPAQMWLQHGDSTPDQLQYGDVNGDGKADALYFDTLRSRGVWVSLSDGTSFSPAEMWVQYGESSPDQIQYADINGDGKADALYFDSGRSNCVRVSLSTGSGFTPPQSWICHGASTADQIQYADVNGDGKADALYFDTFRSRGVWVSLSQGTGFMPVQLWLRHGDSAPNQIQYADVNGDGKADTLYFDTYRSRGVWVSLSTGTGFTAGQMWLQHGDSRPEQIQYADVNGDGKADAIYYDDLRSGEVWVSLSEGNGFATAFLWSTD
jgi:hypothetical protein